jgi:type IV secretory pathway VirB2 component (pilin)
MRSTRIATILAVAISLSALAAQPAAAQTTPTQTWPQRSVKFMLPLGPGSGAGVGARLIGE